MPAGLLSPARILNHKTIDLGMLIRFVQIIKSSTAKIENAGLLGASDMPGPDTQFFGRLCFFNLKDGGQIFRGIHFGITIALPTAVTQIEGPDLAIAGLKGHRNRNINCVNLRSFHELDRAGVAFDLKR